MEDAESPGKKMISDEDTCIRCEHLKKGKDWLPILKERKESTLAPHPYCRSCGLVRNIGPDRAKKVGYYTEVLAELERYLRLEYSKRGKHKLTESQKRLMVMEMEEDALFNDIYGSMASAQKERFVEIVRKYRPDLTRAEIMYYLE